MKHTILLAGITCAPCLLLAQQQTTGGPGQIVTTADIYNNRDLTTAIRPPYILYKDSGYTVVIGYDDVGGCDPYTPNARIITALDGTATDTTFLSEYGGVDLPIKHTTIDTGHHVISYTFDAFEYSYPNIIHHSVYNFMVYICGSVPVPATPPPAATPTPGISLPKVLSLYPNPAKDSLFIAPLDADEASWEVFVFDNEGKAAGSFRGEGVRVAFSITQLKPGQYYSVVKTRKRIIKKPFEVSGN